MHEDLFTNSISGMQATGVPPNIILNYRMCTLERNAARLEVYLSDKIVNISNKVCDSVLENFSVNGRVNQIKITRFV